MSKQSMGDLFLQQRRDRAASSAPSSNLTLLSSAVPSHTNSNSGAKPKSFAEIQREQQNEHKTTQILSRPAPSKTNPNRTARRSSQDQPGPKEQGVIHTLLDKFGFIHCADRPTELFFHYTSTDVPWDDLNIGDQVEFRVGVSEGRRTGEEDKLKALEVRLLPPDSIVWEKEDVVDKRYRGSVKAIPNQKNRGILRAEGEETDAYFTSSDCKSRLGKGDVVEFSVFTERRTGDKLARNIILLQSEKERQRQEKETKLLENAILEQGVVVSDKGDFGFIKSTHRTEEVYFHISHVDIHDESTTLKEGQDVEFYVVDESSLGDGRKKSGRSLAARKIKMLPMGTVKFERVLAEGATGVVVECPIEQGTEGFGRSGNVGKKGNAMGKIRLDVPVRMEGDVDVWEVILHPDLYPGGTYALNRVGSEMVRLRKLIIISHNFFSNCKSPKFHFTFRVVGCAREMYCYLMSYKQFQTENARLFRQSTHKLSLCGPRDGLQTIQQSPLLDS
jgi:cold shock CspA family protein